MNFHNFHPLHVKFVLGPAGEAALRLPCRVILIVGSAMTSRKVADGKKERPAACDL
jgi:hypothetical protein